MPLPAPDPIPYLNPKTLTPGQRNGGAWWMDAFSVLGQYFRQNGKGNPNGRKANSRFTIILSEVTVKVPDENSDRTTDVNMAIAFVSRAGLPRSLRRKLVDLGVPVFQADELKDHAEIIAQGFRNDPDFQAAELGGGVVSYVKNAFMNDTPCSDRCAKAYTGFIRRVKMTQSDRGVLGDEALTPEVYEEITAIGGKGGFYAGVEMLEPGGGGDSDMFGGEPDE